MKIFHVGSHQFRGSLRELLRELWFLYCPSREVPFREWNFVFREWNFEFRELLREYPGTLRELREWPFHSESVFPEIGVVPRLLNNLKMHVSYVHISIFQFLPQTPENDENGGCHSGKGMVYRKQVFSSLQNSNCFLRRFSKDKEASKKPYLLRIQVRQEKGT